DLAAQQRFFDLLDEQSLAANLMKRRVENLVTLRLDDAQLDDQAGLEFAQAIANVVGLPERQRAAARADHDAGHVRPLPTAGCSATLGCACVSALSRSNSLRAAWASSSSCLIAESGACRSLLAIACAIAVTLA